MKDGRKTCAAYIRVSTHDQEEYSPESQLRLIWDYAKRKELLLPEEYIFRDNGISGRTAEKRPGFLRMIATARQKPPPFACILVWKYSRFARNQEESIVYKSLLKKENGIDVISISEPLMEGPFGELIERIIEWFDAFYSANLGTEVRRGMTERAGRGEPVSAPPLGYAYQGKSLVPVPEEAQTVRAIYQDFLKGSSMIAIAKKLNALGIKTKRGGLWENRAVRYVLTNPVYAGMLRWCSQGQNDYHSGALREGTLLVEGRHPPIVSKEQFAQAQARMEEYLRQYKGGQSRAQRQNASRMLQGMVKCGACGSTLSFTGAGMNCSAYIHGRCDTSHFVAAEKLECLARAALRSQLGTLEIRMESSRHPDEELERRQLEQLLRREREVLRRYKEAYSAGVDSLEEYRANKAASGKRSAALRSQLERLAEPAAQEAGAFPRQDISQALAENRLTGQEKNRLFRSVVERVAYHKGAKELEVVYRL